MALIDDMQKLNARLPSIDFSHLNTSRPNLYDAVAALDTELERLKSQTPGLCGRMKKTSGEVSDHEMGILDEMHRGACEQLRAWISNDQDVPEEALSTLALWVSELRDPLPEVGIPRFVTRQQFYDARWERVGNGEAEEKIQVTPRSFDEVCQRLELAEDEVQQLSGRTVLSVGEGASTFAKTLRGQHGVRAVALDRWYHLRPHELNERMLIGASYEGAKVAKVVQPSEALANLPRARISSQGQELPIRDDACDVVFLANVLSWFLSDDYIKNIGLEDRNLGFKILDECIRVTKPGGQVCFNLFDRELDAQWFEYEADHLRFFRREGIEGGAEIDDPRVTALGAEADRLEQEAAKRRGEPMTMLEMLSKRYPDHEVSRTRHTIRIRVSGKEERGDSHG
ncbi:class I SAM-dependent methyltransferase [Myxococcota bacterium]